MMKNRTIEFRVWDNETDKMFLSNCQYGKDEPNAKHKESSVGAFTRLWESLARLKDEQERYILLQFTGLYDVNNVKIFEGHIVEFYDSYARYTETHKGYIYKPEDVRKGVIGYEEDRGSFVILDKNNNLLSLYKNSNKTHHYSIECIEEIKVIGNIFQNPELL